MGLYKQGMVGTLGLEPRSLLRRQILSLLCLPVSPCPLNILLVKYFTGHMSSRYRG